MAAADTLTFDISPPRRPALDDVGGAALIDNALRPPRGSTMPTAAQLNQWALQIQRFGGIVPVALLSVRFTAGVPSLDSFACLPTAPITATFTVTDTATGNTTITWPANTFPSALVKPMVTITEDIAALAPIALLVTNGVQVKTRNAASALTDMAFTVALY